jgi:peptidoglycan/LPS O-acetylase OafA/YrhL
LVAPFQHLNFANYGVMMFYVLSSFLLSDIALMEFEDNSTISIKKYFLRRMLRIWPLYFSYLSLVVLSAVILPKLISFDIGRPSIPVLFFYFFHANWIWTLNHIAFTLDDNFINGGILRILWSLSVEEQFYFIFPFAMLYVLKTKRFSTVIIFIILLSIISKIFFILFHINSVGVNMEGSGMYFSTTTYLDLFLFGGCTAFLLAHKTKHFLDKLLNLPFFVCIIILLFFSLANFHASRTYPYSYFALLIYPTFGLVSAYLLAYSIHNKMSFLSKFLRLPVVRSLGTLSYGIYIWHICVNVFVSNYFFSNYYFSFKTDFQRQFLSTMALLFYMFISISLAALSYLLIESPFLNMRQNSSKGSRFKINTFRWIVYSSAIAFSILVLAMLINSYIL